MNYRNKKNILVVCNDAGGANVVSSFVKANLSKFNFSCLVSGPAVKIFKSKGLKIKEKFSVSPKTILNNFKNISLVLTGSSWSVSTEIDFIAAAKKQRVPTVTFIDHWVNYRERFGFPRAVWRNNLPDEIWVGDPYAHKLAKNFFNNKSIKLKKNWYFKEVKDGYKLISNKVKSKADKILLISEPFNSAINYHGDNKIKKTSEFYIMDSLIDKLGPSGWPIVIRLHPSEKQAKYQKIISKYKSKFDIKLSSGKDPLVDLAQAKYVIGMESAFLVLSALCGKKTFSYIPGNEYQCPLPFKNIIKIHNLNKLISFIR